MALSLEEPGEKVGFDVPVVRAVLPVAEVLVAESVPEMRDDAALSADLKLADGAHRTSQCPDLDEPTRRIAPASRSSRKWYFTALTDIPRRFAIKG